MDWDGTFIVLHRAGRLILGGVTVPCEFGLEGHSDADVLAHAITDALLGAARPGRHRHAFPRYRSPLAGLRQSGISSSRRATWLRAKGYEIVNIDSTVILERPKLKDYRDSNSRQAGRNPWARHRQRLRKVQDRRKSRPGRRGPISRSASHRHPCRAGCQPAAGSLPASGPACPIYPAGKHSISSQFDGTQKGLKHAAIPFFPKAIPMPTSSKRHVR